MKCLGKIELRDLVERVWRETLSRLGEGQVANYIPELAKIHARKLGIAVATIDGDKRGFYTDVTLWPDRVAGPSGSGS